MLGLRYGLTKRIEPCVRGSYLNNLQRISQSDGKQQRSSIHHWNDAVLGINYKFTTSSKTIELLGYLESSAYERYRKHWFHFKNYAAGITGYYSIDPIVLSLTLSYQFGLSRQIAGIQYQPSHYLTINPMVGFAINEKVTLLGGLQWFVRSSEKIADNKETLTQTNTSLQFGIGYGVTQYSTLTLNANIKASGQPSSDIRINFSHTFN